MSHVLSPLDLKLYGTVKSVPALVSALALVLAVIIYRSFTKQRAPTPELPVVGVPGTHITKQVLLEGVDKFPDTPFILPMSPPIVVLPIGIQDEVRNLPDSKVSFVKEHQRNFFAQYTGIGDHRPEMIKAIRIDLTRHIASTIPDLQEEARSAFEAGFGAPCDATTDKDSWTIVPIYLKMLRIVALMNGRIFVGRPLSHNEEWIQSTIGYTMDCVKARTAIREYPEWKRGWVADSLPEIQKLKHHRVRGGEMLKPLMEAQLSKPDFEQKVLNPESGDEEGNFIEWILKYTPEHLRNDPENLALNQMVLAFAGLHTSSMQCTHAVLDLAARREYIDILREEINQVRSADGEEVGEDGLVRLKKDSLHKLRKLDSFMKESQRFSPPIYTSGTRICTSDVHLSTGHTLPKGTRICFPSFAVHTSTRSTTYSPEYNPAGYTAPDQFDGLRFYNLRNMPGKENRHQFATAGPDSLVFGYGNHACPGRFFASNEIKIILVELLMNYDFRLKGDTELKGGADKRPQNMEIDLVVLPNPMTAIEIKRRKI
ncbi:cytochrome P450 [Coniella lustricola]|uniref:Cytochrome P450 n=1 Tax=Coniella lustricola TaxID=2025994 RepID=A0A2T3A664_9PEZI|nr:cytochrome P450 [Coniella lustricola]